MNRLKIGISVGDINGIGLEVIIKALSREEIFEYCTPVIYCSAKIVSYHKNIVAQNFSFNQAKSAEFISSGRVNVVNCWTEQVNVNLGNISEEGGKYAYISLEAATKDLKDGTIDALVTAPINKAAMQMAEFPYPGHTEYLTNALGAEQSLMLMVSDQIRIGLATNHLPVREVADTITKSLLIEKIKIMEQTLRVDFGIERPTIAVLGLNPHAGDDGVIGKEEIEIIRPAILECKKKNMLVMGPFAGDGFFGSGKHAKYDGILAMYHDQGLIPFKSLTFGEGVNYTAGLPFVRTSPDHGTGFDIAGQNIADPNSFMSALFLALDAARNRTQYHADRANELTKVEIKSEAEGEE